MIKLELTVEEMNMILNALSKQPYIEVSNLIGELTRIAKKQLQAEQEAKSE